jgi:autotransporter-associated beta strand protein
LSKQKVECASFSSTGHRLYGHWVEKHSEARMKIIRERFLANFRPFKRPVAIFFAAMVFLFPAHAQNLYWDTNGTNNGGSSSTVAPGTWGMSNFWGTSPAGTNAMTGWTSSGTAGLTQAGAGTLTLNGNNTFMESLTNNAGTLILISSNNNAGVTFLSNGTIDIGNESASGGSTLNPAGGTLLALNTDESLGNAVDLGNDGAIGAAGNTLNLYGGTIQATGGSETIANNLTIGGNGTFGGTDPLTFTAPTFALGASRTFTLNNKITTFTSVITGTSAQNFATSGTGTLELTGANTYSDTTTVNQRTLPANNTTGSATGTKPVTVTSDATPGGTGIIVDNLGAASTVNGIKNANPGTVSQGFTMGSSGGNLNSLTLELGIIDTTAAEDSFETMSAYLYAANSLGVPTGGALNTLATGITVGDIEAGTSEGYTANNTSYIFEYAITLSSHPALTPDDNYAIEISLSSGTQSIGWAHASTEGSGELGEIDVNDASPPVGPGYGEMDMTETPEVSMPVMFIKLGTLAITLHRKLRPASLASV